MSFPPIFDPSTLDGSNGFKLIGPDEFDTSGSAVAAGDINGDGFEDLLIGARNAANDGVYSYDGSAFLVFGSETAPAAEVDLAALDGSNGFHIIGGPFGYYGRLGSQVAIGDINGDGFGDLLMVAADTGTRFESSYSGFGEVAVIFGNSLAGLDADDGSSDGLIDLQHLDGTDGFRFEGATNEDAVGSSTDDALGVGDFNGDGFEDFIVGSIEFNGDEGGNSIGAAFVVFGASDGFPAEFTRADLDGTNGFRFEGDANSARIGGSVDLADLNGDGLADAIVGAFGTDVPEDGAGSVSVLFGKPFGVEPVLSLDDARGFAGFQITGVYSGDAAGGAVNAGDVNGDGLDDLVFALGGADFSGAGAGSVAVVFGPFPPNSTIGLADLNGENGFRIDGDERLRFLGDWVALGDMNGDGRDDIAISSERGSEETYVVFGRDGPGPAVLNVATLDGADGFAIDPMNLGDDPEAVAFGDINNDGFDDLIIGADSADPLGRVAAGETRVIFGRATAPIDRDGTSEDDRLGGGDFSDALRGGVGDDVVTGGAGDDRLEGGDGADDLAGGDGDDEISGGGENDVIEGGEGDDVIKGGSGADIFFGLLGRDRIDGGGGEDELDLRDVDGSVMVKLDNGKAVTSNRDKAWLEGVEDVAATLGDDYLRGDDADNRLIGRAGADEIFGGIGNDALFGSTGADTLRGDEGNDNLFGSSGADDIDGGDGDDVIRAGSGDDRGGGSAGDDEIDGGDGDDLFFGNEGADLMIGGDGDDKLRGQEDDDRLDGGADDDSLRGGDGDDVIEGGDGRDSLQGEDGDDVLIGGGEKDNIFGGAGIDRFVMIDDFEFDKIFDFEDGLEFLDFRQHSTINSIDDLQIQAFGSGDTDTRIRDIADPNDFIVLVDIDVADITEADFLF